VYFFTKSKEQSWDQTLLFQIEEVDLLLRLKEGTNMPLRFCLIEPNGTEANRTLKTGVPFIGKEAVSPWHWTVFGVDFLPESWEGGIAYR